jgi:hypothetical protein
MQLRKISWLRVILGASLLVAIAGVVIGSLMPDWIVVGKYSPQVSFDSTRWLEHRDRSDSPYRRKMVRDLVTNVLPGKSRAEIEALLAQSTFTALNITDRAVKSGGIIQVFSTARPTSVQVAPKLVLDCSIAFQGGSKAFRISIPSGRR